LPDLQTDDHQNVRFCGQTFRSPNAHARERGLQTLV
jgi:hypothetical protein